MTFFYYTEFYWFIYSLICLFIERSGGDSIGVEKNNGLLILHRSKTISIYFCYLPIRRFRNRPRGSLENGRGSIIKISPTKITTIAKQTDPLRALSIKTYTHTHTRVHMRV